MGGGLSRTDTSLRIFTHMNTHKRMKWLSSLTKFFDTTLFRLPVRRVWECVLSPTFSTRASLPYTFRLHHAGGITSREGQHSSFCFWFSAFLLFLGGACLNFLSLEGFIGAAPVPFPRRHMFFVFIQEMFDSHCRTDCTYVMVRKFTILIPRSELTAVLPESFLSGSACRFCGTAQYEALRMFVFSYFEVFFTISQEI